MKASTGARVGAVREPHLQEIGVQAFRRRIGAFLEVYTAAMAPPPDQVPGRSSIMQRHATYPGFRALVVEGRRNPLRLGTGRELVGFIYGFHGRKGQWWHDMVHDALTDLHGPEHADAWLGDAFEVAELHVRPEFQGKGLGRALLSGICAGRPEQTIVLSTLDLPDSKARHLYRSSGLVDLLTHFEFPGGGPAYAVMGARLPLNASSPADTGASHNS